MMPSPTHLVGWIKPDSDIIDEENFEGKIKCPCGNETFEVSHPGNMLEDRGEKFPCTIEIDSKFFFLIKVKCSDCSEEKIIFDADFHGWDGYVCHDPEQANIERPNLQLWNCSACNSPKHSVHVQIQTEGKQDFIEESSGEFPEERWVDAFGWIDIDLRCSECEKETIGWISYETM